MERDPRPLAPWEGTLCTLRRQFVRGDANQDAAIDISDPIEVLESLFVNGLPFACPNAADANDDNAIDIADAIFILQFLFQGTRPMPAPFPEPGYDPNPAVSENTGCFGL